LPPPKALIDTTVLTDALLKQTADGHAARAALKAIPETQLPLYAIKEFKNGPLRSYVWLFNKIAASSWTDAINAIPNVFMQRNLQQTALRAVADFQSSLASKRTDDLVRKYGNGRVGDWQTAEAKIWLKTLIVGAWRRRRKVTTRVIGPLSCYNETDIVVRENGTIDIKPTHCGVPDCCLRIQFVKKPDVVEALLDACDQLPDKNETRKRRQALRHLHRTPNRDLDEKQCFALGDAVFAIQCPKDAVILTTNIKDHGPLAAAAGVKAVKP
jgi:hypothetical protein